MSPDETDMGQPAENRLQDAGLLTRLSAYLAERFPLVGHGALISQFLLVQSVSGPCSQCA
jgi:hypothetical protein